MTFATLAAAALALAAAQSGLQVRETTPDNPLGLPPGVTGDVRITRVEDPRTVCLLTATIESQNSPAPISSVARKARIVREGEITTVSVRASPREGSSRRLICVLDTASRHVTSVRFGGRELLSAPQPY